MRKLLSVLLITAVLGANAAGDHCKSIKKDGTACKAWAGKSGYCYFHDPANKCEGKRKDGQPCGAIKVTGTHFCHNHQTK